MISTTNAQRILTVAPAIAGAGLFCVWAASQGGYEETALYPGGLLLVGLALLAGLATSVSADAPSRGTLACLGLLTAFVAWGYLSIGWASDQGAAWDGANRAAVYLLAFAVFALPGWSPRPVALAFCAWIAGLAAIGWVEVISTASAADPTGSLMEMRFAQPVGYHNASAALFAIAAIPALALSSRPELGRPGRAVLLGLSGALFELALLPQSRGAVIAAVGALVVLVAVSPSRGRLLVGAVAIAIAVAASSSALLDPYAVAQDGGDLGAAYSTAARAIGLSFVGLVAVGAALAALDHRWQRSSSATRKLSIGLGAATAMFVVAAAVAVLVAIGNPVEWADARWAEFKADGQPSTGSQLRYGAAGNGRYDYWRVSLEELRSDPVEGAGLGSFASDYLADRRTPSEPAYSHSTPMQILGELGLVGGVLFVAFVAVAVGRIVAVRRRGEGLVAALAGAALAVLAYFLLQGSVDWIWEFPAIAAPVFALLGCAAGLRGRDRGEEPPRSGLPGRVVPVAAVAVAAVAAVALAASFTLPWAAAEDTDAALAGWGTDLQGAYERLDRASSTNFLSSEPAVAGGTIASLAGDGRRAEDWFEQAIARDPVAWYPRLQLGVLQIAGGDRAAGIKQLDVAHRLSPTDYLITNYRRQARTGEKLSVDQLNADLEKKLCERIGGEAQYCENRNSTLGVRG